MNVADAIARFAGETPYRAAIIEPDRVVHWRELDAAVWRAAAFLASSGLRPGDRVGLFGFGASAHLAIVSISSSLREMSPLYC